MNYRLHFAGRYVAADLEGRETAQEMREFLNAVHAACREHGCPRVLMHIRRSRAIFKAEDYGLDGSLPGYLSGMVSSACQVALVGDTPELNSAHEYIELVARQQKMNVRAFRDAHAAVHWLSLETVDAGADPERSA